ncbi:short-chain dehydrogenase [Arthrobacter livingstonensis]|uniref:Short-chain dehydrogenase n=1 Tax=Arthrobacter livingstonensis TaxID=670078 RepID=A0A2V5L2M8_9MICC|nr:SDR family oxidoreductase [Arthrobacter livingstonensis]PYI64394.1 short-chain dehydrogenase [Arthrobacter livingstonensis]
MSTQRFSNSVAFVTGAASGIGLAIVERLLNEGARVIGMDLNAEGLKSIAEALGESFQQYAGDVTSENDISAAIASGVERFGELTTAFNVAGAARMAPIVDLEQNDWKFTTDLVLNGVFLSTKHAARSMIRGGQGGTIVNLSSLNAHLPLFGGSAYSSAKAGVEMFSKNAALELGRHDIRVNAVLPGMVATPMTQFMRDTPGIMKEFNDHVVIKRAAEPAEIAAPALWLAAADSSYVTGTSLVVDGGYEICGYPDFSRHMAASREGNI